MYVCIYVSLNKEGPFADIISRTVVSTAAIIFCRFSMNVRHAHFVGHGLGSSNKILMAVYNERVQKHPRANAQNTC